MPDKGKIPSILCIANSAALAAYRVKGCPRHYRVGGRESTITAKPTAFYGRLPDSLNADWYPNGGLLTGPHTGSNPRARPGRSHAPGMLHPASSWAQPDIRALR
jgi:hypothetical protein